MITHYLFLKLMNILYHTHRAVSAVILLLMVSVCPVHADTTYRISSAQELVDFSTLVNSGQTSACAELTADIDMTGIAFTPIGNTEANRYQGTFDGNGYCIDNLTVSASGQSGVGIFGYVENATIQYLIAGPGNRIEGQAYVGGLVGSKVSGGTATLRGCGHEGYVVCSAQNGAAMVGCVHSGNLIIDHCYNTGKVKGGRESAIFCGWFGGSGSAITDSYNSGSMVSGVDGSNYLWRSSPSATRIYDTSGRQNATRFTSTELKSGALTWKLNGNSPDGHYRQNLEGEQVDLHPTTCPRHATVYVCGHLQCDGSPYPGTTPTYGNAEDATFEPHKYDEGVCSVCQLADAEYLYPDAQGYFQLSTPYALRWFAAYVNADASRAGFCARITEDLNMKGISYEGLGTAAAPYAGELDGGGHLITNLSLKQSTKNDVGFINVAHTSLWLHDLTLGTGCSFAGYRYVGGFIGRVDGINGDKIRLARLGFEGTVTVNNNGGGIIGCIPNNDIKAYLTSCYSTGSVNGSTECGALSGWSSYARLTNCYVRVRGAGFETDHNVVRGFTPVFVNCYGYGVKQTADGLNTTTLAEIQNGKLLEKLNDAAFSQEAGVDANPKLKGGSR